MITLQLRYENNRCTDDLEVVLVQLNGEQWVMSFVATVPHSCESPRVFGDLFECGLEDIVHETVPVVKGSQRELAIIHKLKEYANTAMTSDEQQRLLHSMFPRMTAKMADHRTLLWLIGVLEERRKRADAELPPRA